MNYAQKNGTLFDIKNGNIVLPEAADKLQQTLANQLLYNSSVNRSKKLKSKF
jgi:hypothetical protein